MLTDAGQIVGQLVNGGGQVVAKGKGGADGIVDVFVALLIRCGFLFLFLLLLGDGIVNIGNAVLSGVGDILFIGICQITADDLAVFASLIGGCLCFVDQPVRGAGVIFLVLVTYTAIEDIVLGQGAVLRLVDHAGGVVITVRYGNTVHGGICQRIAHNSRVAVQIVQGSIGGVLQGVQLIADTAAAFQNQIRGHLTDNTAYILAAQNIAAVYTSSQITGLAAGNAAYIISIVLVTDGCGIFTGLYNAGIDAGDTAYIGYGIDLGIGKGLNTENIIQIQRFERKSFLKYFVIDGSVIAAITDGAFIIAHNAANKVLGRHGALRYAILHDAIVFTGNAAGIQKTGYGAVELTVAHKAIVGAHNATYRTAGAAGGYGTGDLQVYDRAFGAQIAEQTLMGAVRGTCIVADRMAVAEESAGEGGNRHESNAIKVDVLIQRNDQPLGIALHLAANGQSFQILCLAEMDINIYSGRSGFCRSLLLCCFRLCRLIPCGFILLDSKSKGRKHRHHHDQNQRTGDQSGFKDRFPLHK